MFSRTQAARMVGVHEQTLRNWEKNGKFRPSKKHSRSGRVVYTDQDIQELMKFKDDVVDFEAS